MAERRMFAKSIIGSARFLRMPPSSRLLYYDLGMYADDDGVVEAFSVMRQTSATEDDLRVLVSKGFVTVLNEDLVSLITDWNTNNFIRSDRYHPSIYKNLVLQLTDGIPSDNQVATIGIPRLGKDSIGKDRVGKDKYKDEFEKLWEIYPRKQGKKKALDSYIKARKEGTTYEEVEEGIFAYARLIKAEHRDEQYIKHGSTFFSQRAWLDDFTVNVTPQNKPSGNPFMDMLKGGMFDE